MGGAILISIIHMYNAGLGLDTDADAAKIWGRAVKSDEILVYVYDKFKILLGFWKEVFFSNFHAIFIMKMNNAQFHLWFKSHFFSISVATD